MRKNEKLYIYIPAPPFESFLSHIRTLWYAPAYHRQLSSWTKQYEKICMDSTRELSLYPLSVTWIFYKKSSSNTFLCLPHAKLLYLFDGLISNVFAIHLVQHGVVNGIWSIHPLPWQNWRQWILFLTGVSVTWWESCPIMRRIQHSSILQTNVDGSYLVGA